MVVPIDQKFVGVLTLGLLAFVFVSCDKGVGLVGKVVDEEARPVAGARIIMVFHGETSEGISKEDGRFVFISTVGPFDYSTLKLTVKKDGFESYESEFSSSDIRQPAPDNEKTIMLTKFSLTN